VWVLFERDPALYAGYQPRQTSLSSTERKEPVIDPVRLQQVEGLEDGIGASVTRPRRPLRPQPS
jgi:hypothetical protein